MREIMSDVLTLFSTEFDRAGSGISQQISAQDPTVGMRKQEEKKKEESSGNLDGLML